MKMGRLLPARSRPKAKASVVKSSRKVRSLGPAARDMKKAKEGDKEFVIRQDTDEESVSGGATQGTKRKRTDGNEDKEGADEDGNLNFEGADFENQAGPYALEGQLDGAFEL